MEEAREPEAAFEATFDEDNLVDDLILEEAEYTEVPFGSLDDLDAISQGEGDEDLVLDDEWVDDEPDDALEVMDEPDDTEFLDEADESSTGRRRLLTAASVTISGSRSYSTGHEASSKVSPLAGVPFTKTPLPQTFWDSYYAPSTEPERVSEYDLAVARYMSQSRGLDAIPEPTAAELEAEAAWQDGWQDDANCLGVDPDLFFPERGASTREAKEVCRGCIVKDQCLEFALVNGEKFGIWGGMSERERRRIRRTRAIARRAQAATADA